jgi:tryptophanyl-tRNA synthetase
MLIANTEVMAMTGGAWITFNSNVPKHQDLFFFFSKQFQKDQLDRMSNMSP